MLIDLYGRPLLHLRLSVTRKCNYRCIYCHMEGELTHSLRELSVDQIRTIASAVKSVGISKVKITGGEPLVRKDIADIVKVFSDLKFDDIAITTNGYYLEDLIDNLVGSGLNRVNINLPSLREEVYCRITGVSGLGKVLKGIDRALNLNLKPIKINYVVLKDVNDNEFWSMVDYARKKSLHLQVIELEPVGVDQSFYNKYHRSIDDFEEEVSKAAIKVYRRKHMHNRPQYDLGDVIIEFVRSVHNPTFCKHCTRIRVTSDGYFKPCLLREDRNVLIDFSRGVKGVLESLYKANMLREPYYKS